MYSAGMPHESNLRETMLAQFPITRERVSAPRLPTIGKLSSVIGPFTPIWEPLRSSLVISLLVSSVLDSMAIAAKALSTIITAQDTFVSAAHIYEVQLSNVRVSVQRVGNGDDLLTVSHAVHSGYERCTCFSVICCMDNTVYSSCNATTISGLNSQSIRLHS